MNDIRGEFNLNDLKRVTKFMNFKDFISDLPTKRYQISVGIAVMEVRDSSKREKILQIISHFKKLLINHRLRFQLIAYKIL